MRAGAPPDGEVAGVMEPREFQERGPATPSTVLANRSFLFLVLAHGSSGLAFWSYFAGVFAEAANEFNAGVGEMAILGASLSVPFILGSLIQGLVVDRWSPKWLSFLGYLMLGGAIPTAWAADSLLGLYVSSFMVGVAYATIEPSRSALTGLLVEESTLVKANSVMAISFQISLVIGDIGGGILADAFGTDLVFAVAAAVTVLPLAFMLGVPDVRQKGERPAVSLTDLRVGAATAWHNSQLRLLLLVTGLGWGLINTFFVLEPIYVKDTLHRTQEALFYLWAAHGAGALVGALSVARGVRRTGHEPGLICAGVALVGTGILVYAAVGVYEVALAAAFVQGFGFALFFPPLFAFIQRVVVEEQRGRVTSVFVAVQEAMGLVSSLVILALGTLIVVGPTLVGSGVVLGIIGIMGLRSFMRSQEVHVVVMEDDEPAA